jgi:hypothetical protein
MKYVLVSVQVLIQTDLNELIVVESLLVLLYLNGDFLLMMLWFCSEAL